MKFKQFVPLDYALHPRGLPLASRYSCCSEEEETMLHLFAYGPVSVEVWWYFANIFGIPYMPFEDLQLLWMTWSTSLPLILSNHIRCIIPLVVVWFIWQGRNKARFERHTFSA